MLVYQCKQDPDIRCPLEYGLSPVRNRWKSRILCVPAKQESLRYNVLMMQMVNVTDAVLSATLCDLAKDTLITRTQYEHFPPRVEYFLIERDREIIRLRKTICA